MSEARIVTNTAVYEFACLPGEAAPRELIRNATASRDPYQLLPPGHPDSVYSASRAHFEAGETDRLNSAHWQMADTGEQPIDQVLAERLPTLRARSQHERLNNPTIEGLALGHTLAVCGEDGPLLDLWGESDADDAWCDQAEQVWQEWCERADAAGGLTLGGLLKQWNNSCWTNGEFLEQIVSEEAQFLPTDGVSMRLHGIEVQRLQTPAASMNDALVCLGVKKNRYRRPTHYWIANHFNNGWATEGNWYKADSILHGWDRVQADRTQTRGIPWMQSGLPLAADLRDYDVAMLDAARSAADNAIFVFTRHPDADFTDNVPRSISWRRRQLNHIAPGWELGSPQSNQPLPQYKDYRHERMNDLGRGKGVPGMVTRLDARDHNYSSARFDYQLLGESAKHVRASLYNPLLQRLVMLVLSEAQLRRLIAPAPLRFWQQFVWPALPEIDAEKSAKAETIYLANGTVSYTEACMRWHGRRSRDTMRWRQRDARRLQAHGLPPVQATQAAASAPGEGSEEISPSEH